MAAAENYNFSKHLLGDGGLHDIIKAFCVHKQTYPNGYYYEELEEGQERILWDIECYVQC